MGSKQENDDIKHFNRRAATYETSWSQKFFFDRVQKMALNLAKKGNTPEAILDVGCGTGRLLRKANQQWPNARLIGVDAAEKMIEQATQLFPQAEFHFAMAEALPLPDASVDLAFSTLSFHHWANQANGVSEVERVLRPQGSFLLVDITIPSWLSRFVPRFKRNSPARIREMFTEAGLTVKRQRQPWRWSRVMLVTVGKKL